MVNTTGDCARGRPVKRRSINHFAHGSSAWPVFFSSLKKLLRTSPKNPQLDSALSFYDPYGGTVAVCN